MVEMLRANSDKLDNLTGDVNYLIDSEKIDKTDNLSSSIIRKLEGLRARQDNMNLLFVAMLADISFTTSLRIAKHEDDMKHLFNYFRYNTNTDTKRCWTQSFRQCFSGTWEHYYTLHVLIICIMDIRRAESI